MARVTTIKEEWQYHPIYRRYSRLVYVQCINDKKEIVATQKVFREYKDIF